MQLFAIFWWDTCFSFKLIERIVRKALISDQQGLIQLTFGVGLWDDAVAMVLLMNPGSNPCVAVHCSSAVIYIDCSCIAPMQFPQVCTECGRDPLPWFFFSLVQEGRNMLYRPLRFIAGLRRSTDGFPVPNVLMKSHSVLMAWISTVSMGISAFAVSPWELQPRWVVFLHLMYVHSGSGFAVVML